MRIGILGGTFDPIHHGHLIVAEESRLCLGLDRVLLIPTGQPWMKEGRRLSAPGDRLAMVRLAVQCNPFFEVSTLEMDRPGPTYTVDTLRELRRSWGRDVDLYFILGVDSLQSFRRWKEPEAILSLCTLAVVTRPGHQRHDPGILEGMVADGLGKAIDVPAPLMDLSGTLIRQRVSQGASIRYQVPPAVERYIWSHHLYQGKK